MTTRIVLVGGFLGAGKTTLLLHAAQRLVARGYRVGMITNDQGEELIDTALGQESHIPVTEVAGGCFCCRFPDLLTSLEHLQKTAEPQLILAEPVGSCTDLVSTVLRPLVQFYGEHYELAPLTVLLDGSRVLDDFTPEVRYLYRQQLAEAELILLSKSDLLSEQELAAQQTAGQKMYPHARLLSVSGISGHGLDAWLDIMLGQRSTNPNALVIDYEQYAKAEAALGWLNARGQVRADRIYSYQQWMTDLLTSLGDICAQMRSPVAHIKAMLTSCSPPGGQSSTSVTSTKLKASLVQSASSITWDMAYGSQEGVAHEFVLNARVHTTPELLGQITMQALERAKPDPASRYYLEHFECFSPLPPHPHHRL